MLDRPTQPTRSSTFTKSIHITDYIKNLVLLYSISIAGVVEGLISMSSRGRATLPTLLVTGPRTWLLLGPPTLHTSRDYSN